MAGRRRENTPDDIVFRCYGLTVRTWQEVGTDEGAGRYRKLSLGSLWEAIAFSMLPSFWY